MVMGWLWTDHAFIVISKCLNVVFVALYYIDWKGGFQNTQQS